MQKVSKNSVSANDEAVVRQLQKEVQHLREILKLRKKGDQVEISSVMYQLKEENQRLRQMALSANEVEKLKQENKLMRLEIQRLKQEGLLSGYTSQIGGDQPSTYSKVDEDGEDSEGVFDDYRQVLSETPDKLLAHPCNRSGLTFSFNQKDDLIAGGG